MALVSLQVVSSFFPPKLVFCLFILNWAEIYANAMFIMKHCVLYITLCSKSNAFKCSFFLRSRCGQCFEVHDFHHDFYCLQYIQLVEIIVTWHEPLHPCCPTLCIDGTHIKLQSLVCIMFSRPILALHPFFFSVVSILLRKLQMPEYSLSEL